MKVAIFGCGPAGLLAAQACWLEDVDFTIISDKRKSKLYGSQYLHEHIPGVNEVSDAVEVEYIVRGTPEEYRRKTHGKFWDGIIAPEDFETHHMAWDIRQAYDRLWDFYEDSILQYVVTRREEYQEIRHDPMYNNGRIISKSIMVNDTFSLTARELGFSQYDLIVSTIPRTMWMIDGEEFKYSVGWAMGDAPDRNHFVPFEVPDNTIICDGTDDVDWTRLSRVFGHTTVEWPTDLLEAPHPAARKVLKPLAYTPAPQNNNPTRDWLHVGRYGKFEKGIVVSDAFNEVTARIKEMKS